jgi:uncharacterized membrane protein YccF (DUF307 family)
MILLKPVYVLCIGIPLCAICMTIGVLFCLTIVGIPLGLTFFALGFKVLG